MIGHQGVRVNYYVFPPIVLLISVLASLIPIWLFKMYLLSTYGTHIT